MPETAPHYALNAIGAVVLFVAAVIATALPSFGATGAFPWRAGDNPPVIAGVTLGDTEDRARTLLGIPKSAAKMGNSDVLDYPTGLQIIANKEDGVSILRLRAPAAGSIDGIRIGDDMRKVLAKWGPPDAGQGNVSLYNAGVWTVEIKSGDNNRTVIDILLGWNSTKWPGSDTGRGQYYRPQ